jgi:hypothetical protein
MVFGLTVILVYYLFQWIIPDTNNSRDQIITLLFIITSVLILFPARDRMLSWLMQESEYQSLFGKDVHHIDVIGKHFTMNSLIEEIFPDLLRWLNVSSGKLAILDPERKSYTFYIYGHGRLLKKDAQYHNSIDEIEKELLTRREAIYQDLPGTTPHFREVMVRFRAVLIQPIFYRKRLVGFLILHEYPRHKYERRALDLFADKAGVSIHGHILSSRIVDTGKYEQEFRTADRIRQFLQNTEIPEIPGYQVKSLKAAKALTLIEFFSSTPDKRFLVIVYSPKISSAAGLILSGILGHLYSYIHLEENIVLHKLIGHLRKDTALHRSEYRMDIFVAKLNERTGAMSVVPDPGFEITDMNGMINIHIIPDWRNRIELERGKTYRIGMKTAHEDIPLLEITRMGVVARNETTSYIQPGPN